MYIDLIGVRLVTDKTTLSVWKARLRTELARSTIRFLQSGLVFRRGGLKGEPFPSHPRRN